MENIKNTILKYIVKFKIIFFIWGFIGYFASTCLHNKSIIGLFFALSALASLIFFVYISVKYIYHTDDDFITYKKTKP